ncbi:E3 ubiquitin-protein ligase RNF115 [Papilio machaon]|uniref:E3 ubiquitin-protein ligase RNF115 n=1 Tax=Papilio machaon TaxID=76193 RepID=A0A194RB02_PAPMA|nr:E3 ubiquitin-protein ligase RNF115 [Papilio machaon]
MRRRGSRRVGGGVCRSAATLQYVNHAHKRPHAPTRAHLCKLAQSLCESVSRLECLHMYHSTCIRPWLQLHATCPICRRSLIPQPPPGNPAPQPTVTSRRLYTPPSLPRVILRRLTRRPQTTGPQTQTWDSLADSSSTSGSTSTTSSVTTGGVWAPQRSTSNSTGSNSTTSLNSSNDRGERQYNMDIDYD